MGTKKAKEMDVSLINWEGREAAIPWTAIIVSLFLWGAHTSTQDKFSRKKLRQ